MFVVKVENDEATLYRAFRRAQTARAWAAERNLEDADCLVDIFETAGTDDPQIAVATARSGNAREFLRVETATIVPPAILAARDIHFGRAAASL